MHTYMGRIRTYVQAWLPMRRCLHTPALADAAPPPLCALLPCLQIYSLWNFRREALQEAIQGGGEGARRAAEGELALTAACLQVWGAARREGRAQRGTAAGGGRPCWGFS